MTVWPANIPGQISFEHGIHRKHAPAVELVCRIVVFQQTHFPQIISKGDKELDCKITEDEKCLLASLHFDRDIHSIKKSMQANNSVHKTKSHVLILFCNSITTFLPDITNGIADGIVVA